MRAPVLTSAQSTPEIVTCSPASHRLAPGVAFARNLLNHLEAPHHHSLLLSTMPTPQLDKRLHLRVAIHPEARHKASLGRLLWDPPSKVQAQHRPVLSGGRLLFKHFSG